MFRAKLREAWKEAGSVEVARREEREGGHAGKMMRRVGLWRWRASVAEGAEDQLRQWRGGNGRAAAAAGEDAAAWAKERARTAKEMVAAARREPKWTMASVLIAHLRASGRRRRVSREREQANVGDGAGDDGVDEEREEGGHPQSQHDACSESESATNAGPGPSDACDTEREGQAVPAKRTRHSSGGGDHTGQGNANNGGPRLRTSGAEAHGEGSGEEHSAHRLTPGKDQSPAEALTRERMPLQTGSEVDEQAVRCGDQGATDMDTQEHNATRESTNSDGGAGMSTRAGGRDSRAEGEGGKRARDDADGSDEAASPAGLAAPAAVDELPLASTAAE